MRSLSRYLVLSIVPAILCTTSATAQAFAPARESVELRPGDVLRITVWRMAELSGEFVVAGDGSLTHPLYRSIRVDAVPMATVEERVRSFLTGFEPSPHFVVEPLLRVMVGGEVARPNLYSLRPETSILQAVAMAGGSTERGRRDRVLLERDGTQVVIGLSPGADVRARMPIRSGDQLLVERRRSLFRELIAPTITLAGASAAIINAVLRSR